MMLDSWISHWAQSTPQKAAIIFHGKPTTYAALEREISGLAADLRHSFGIEPGDRVAWLGHNSPRVIEILFACARIGAILVPLNWRLAVPELIHILEDAGAELLVVAEDQQQVATTLVPQLDHCRPVHAYQDHGNDAWPVLRALPGQGEVHRAPGRDPSDNPLLILYTSGTTGRPKGVVLTHTALAFSARNSVRMHGMSAADHVLMVLPMFHAGGFNIHTLAALSVGATLTLHSGFEPASVLAEINRGEITLTGLVPAQISALVAHPDWLQTAVGSLRCVTTGSTFVPEGCVNAWRERGVPAIEVYGSTETCAVAIHDGQAAECFEVRVVDAQGRAVTPGDNGEVLVKGPALFTSYWNKPQATAEALRDGWFHSGDIGLQNKDGRFVITDRKADRIISGGENIYPAELESVLDEHPDISEAAVIGQTHARWGEVPVAFVVTSKHTQLDQDSVLALFKNRLAGYKCPQRVIFMDNLPRNAMGKIEKFELRRQLRREKADNYD